MKNDEPASAPSFEQQATKAIKDLQNFQLQHMNRQLAFEAMLEAMLARIQPEALPGLLEAYDAACDRLATFLTPEHQRPEIWKQWEVAIANQMQLSRRAPTTARPQGPTSIG